MKVPEGWGELISRLPLSVPQKEKFINKNTGMYEQFSGSEKELGELATAAYKHRLEIVDGIGKQYGLDAEREARQQAIDWYKQ